jgi:hypothetical protein
MLLPVEQTTEYRRIIFHIPHGSVFFFYILAKKTILVVLTDATYDEHN